MIRPTKALLDIRAAAMLAVALPVLVHAAQAPPLADGSKKPASEAAQKGDHVTQTWTDHLNLRTYPSAAVIAPGGRTSLVIEVEPREGMHVYAPGAESYRVVTLSVATPPFVRMLPIQYPPSEIYVFVPLNERIPVYQRPFTLRQSSCSTTSPGHGQRFSR